MAESGVIFKDRTNTGGENEMKNEKAMRPFGIRDKVGYMLETSEMILHSFLPAPFL